MRFLLFGLLMVAVLYQSGEEEVNALLTSGKWRVVEFRYDDELLVARLVKVRV